MNIAYVRVSTVDQNESRQKEALSKYNIEKWYIEKVSGKNMNRPKLNEMLDFIREGDIVYIEDFSRLARSTQDLLTLINTMKEKNVQVISMKENFDLSTPNGRLMLTMIAAINEFEREIILERQREGIEIAKREGKYKGRQSKEVDPVLFDKYYSQYMDRSINKSEFANKLRISRPTLDRLLKDYQK